MAALAGDLGGILRRTGGGVVQAGVAALAGDLGGILGRTGGGVVQGGPGARARQLAGGGGGGGPGVLEAPSATSTPASAGGGGGGARALAALASAALASAPALVVGFGDLLVDLVEGVLAGLEPLAQPLDRLGQLAALGAPVLVEVPVGARQAGVPDGVGHGVLRVGHGVEAGLDALERGDGLDVVVVDEQETQLRHRGTSWSGRERMGLRVAPTVGGGSAESRWGSTPAGRARAGPLGAAARGRGGGGALRCP